LKIYAVMIYNAFMLYREAGVDLNRASNFLSKINMLVDTQSFGAKFPLKKVLSRYNEPVLVSATDGIGTKILLAIKYNKLDGLGQDLVAMVLNDIAAEGAEPIFFLDYIATSRLHPDIHAKVVIGIVNALKKVDGCQLLGGETAELPDMFQFETYFDIAGFGVGVAEESVIPNPERVKPGDLVIGIRSSGIHSNGFTLVRKVLEKKPDADKMRLEGKPIRDILLEPTRLYVKEAVRAIRMGKVKGAAHITGGGIKENLQRRLNPAVDAVIFRQKIPVHPIFRFIQKLGNIPEEEMWSVFNMGIGFALIVAPDDLKSVQDIVGESIVIGEIVKGTGEVKWVL